MKQEKPVVYYRDDLSVHCIDNGKYYAKVEAIDHPIIGTGLVRTSQILNINFATGEFETINTVYKRALKPIEELFNVSTDTASW